MDSITFLDKLSAKIKEDFPLDMNCLTIVVPNKRAGVFLLDSLKKHYTNSVFAPEIISVEELIQRISGIKSIDSIELLFEFYSVYKEIHLEKSQDFDRYANWAKMLLQDFNEIDRYLLKPDHVFSYLKDIEDIKHWSLDPDQRTALMDNYLEFWKRMPEYYETLYACLLSKKRGYQGLIYREAVKKKEIFLEENKQQQFYFAGFNALNAAEELIIQHILLEGRGRVFWDIDEIFLNDPYHDAGLFLRRIKKNWKYYQTHPFEWIVDDFGKEKNIKIIQTPKSVGQAKIVGQILEGTIESGAQLDKTAVVLGDENLLLPVLYALPDKVNSLNITMGYGGKSNPVLILLNKIFKMHLSALRREGSQYIVYYKEVIDVLANPIFTSLVDATGVINEINKKNLTFFSLARFSSWGKESQNQLLQEVLESWEQKTPKEMLQKLLRIVLEIKEKLSNEGEEVLVKTFLYAAYNLLNRLVTYCEKYDFITSYETLYALYKQVMEMAEVSFEGEPLQGLQVMGVLESRVLDFDTVIVTSVNEGKFPSGKTQNSFIPYDVKREFGLPTFKEKDAIYSFHFYHLLLRAKNIYLLYNSQSEGLDAGEKSRFLTQLEIEKQPKHHLSNLIYSAFLPEKAYEPIKIEKSILLQQQLEKIATETKGFSPSSLSSYLRNPVQFYMQRVLRIKEVEEVEENVALNTLGTIIHNALENLYRPYVGFNLVEFDVKKMLEIADEEVAKQFEEVYNSDKERMGKNLLAFEVAKRNVYHFLKEELEKLREGDEVRILELEKELFYTLLDESLPYPVNLFGVVDRIEERNGIVRVIDYKTGRVNSNDVKLSKWEGLTMELKNDKIIQLLLYALMYSEENEDKSIEAGIYSFKNRKEGFLFFGVREGRNVNCQINQEILEIFKTELIQLIIAILNPAEAFVEEIK